MTPSSPPAAPRHVLIVEDDYFQATDLAAILMRAGCHPVTVVGSADAVRRTIDVALPDTRLPDAAIVDIDLGHGPCFAAADHLSARGVPILFLTGHDPADAASRFPSAPVLVKPCPPHRLIAALNALIDGGRRPKDGKNGAAGED